MILPNMAQIYLKTTETCNLNCKHCFTSGSNGRKIFFDTIKTLDFFERLKRDCTWIKGLSFVYHGGEPMLAPLKDLELFKIKVMDIFPDSTFGIQTNLVYNLNPEIVNFFQDLNGVGISWDFDIRFENKAQYKLWEKNVKILAKKVDKLTLTISLSKNLIKEKSAKHIIEFAIDLGFKHILFERITSDGNALNNPNIIPNHIDASIWCYQMYQDTLEYKLYEKIDNMMLATIAEGIFNKNNIATSCRNCEQTMLTINADGTIAGCANSAPRENWGNIGMRVLDVLNSKNRIKTVMCEATKNPICYTCKYLSVCNGGCHRLAWQENECPAPKLIFEERPENFEVLLYGR